MRENDEKHLYFHNQGDNQKGDRKWIRKKNLCSIQLGWIVFNDLIQLELFQIDTHQQQQQQHWTMIPKKWKKKS